MGIAFTIINRNIKWLKVKIKEDNYIGFIKNRNYIDYLKPTHKISKLNAKIYKFPNKRKKINELLLDQK